MMHRPTESGDRSGRGPRRWALLLALALLAALAAGGGAFSAPDNLHPSVYAWARAHPGQPVPVIVQTDGHSQAVAQAIDSLGGEVERRFSIIPALEASLPADALASLASHPDVAWVSLDAPVVPTGVIDASKLASAYPLAVDADAAWAQGIAGQGVSVAVVDTGISPADHPDFTGDDGASRVIAEVAISATAASASDGYGHGTHIAGIVGGDGSQGGGRYIGIAPEVNLINVKVADDEGRATLADVIAGLEWVYQNRDRYDIRVVNLSLHSSVAQSYLVDPLDAAVEFLWFNDLFVVVAAGNLGDSPDAVSYPPANDPFVMTVGAIDDRGTPDFGDDVITSWSSRGVTQDGFPKPEMVAPGRNIVSVIDPASILYQDYPERIVDNGYFRLSGTSMAAGVMSGVAALIRERYPDWTPAEVKCTLIALGRPLADGDGLVPHLGSAIADQQPQDTCNDGITPSFLLSQAPVVQVGAVAYVLGSHNPEEEAKKIGLKPLAALGGPDVRLENVDWSAIKWDAIKWDAIKWDAIKWDAIKWSAIKWDAIKWSAIKWSSGIDFDAIKWSAIKWSAIKWDAIKWSGGVDFDAIKWSAIKWDLFPGD